ncbi:hypothetical protein C0J52_12007 [Blattella germanica]|nr:hypothetical protein C0J52_12007 [Blattella germanica]
MGDQQNKPPHQDEYRYDGNCEKYIPTNNTQQKILNGRFISTWNERGAFFLTSLGFTTGLQGICLFPILCEQNGGTAFIFCTAILYLILGIPVVLVESGLGQLSRLSPTTLFPKLCPLLSVASTANYFTTEILGISPGLESFGKIQGHLVLGLAITWGTIAACLGSGIRHTGKLCYITTPITFLVAGIVLVRGLFLWNSTVSQMVAPDWSSLTNLSVWLMAGCYVFYSLNLGLGGLIVIGSHNKQSTNLLRDAMLVCLFHFLWGMTMWLAYACLVADYKVRNETSTSGPWVLFVTIARGLSTLPHGIVFSMALYIMVFFVGLGTLLGTVLMIVSTILDIIPYLQNKRGPVTTGVCAFLFLIGIPLTSQAGLHIHLLLSSPTINWSLSLHALCTCIAVTFCYGQKKFISDLCSLSNIRLGESILTHLIVLFSTIVPVFIVILMLCSFHHSVVVPNGISPQPQWMKPFGWFLTSVPAVIIPLCAIFRFIKFSNKQSIIQSLKLLLQPDDIWTEYMSSKFHSSTSEKTTMTTPIIVEESKDLYFVQSLPPGDGNNNIDEYMVSIPHQKPCAEHSSF